MVSASRPRRRRAYRDTSDLLAALSRLITAVGARVGDGTLEDLATLLSLHSEIDSAVVEAVQGLKQAGHTWAEIGAATGTSREAAFMKWANKI